MCALLGLACAEGSPSTLALRVLDETGKPTVPRVRMPDSKREPRHVAAADGPALTAVHRNLPELGAVVPGERGLQLPPGRFTIVADRGPEYRRVEFQVDTGSEGRLTHTARLQRWVNM